MISPGFAELPVSHKKIQPFLVSFVGGDSCSVASTGLLARREFTGKLSLLNHHLYPYNYGTDSKSVKGEKKASVLSDVSVASDNMHHSVAMPQGLCF